jgi:hypothetical protein
MGYFDGKCQLFEARCKKQEIRLVPGTKYQVSRALPAAGRREVDYNFFATFRLCEKKTFKN